MGARAYTVIERYSNIINRAVVEIGSERNEGSTTYLSKYCNKIGVPFYTVDFNNEAYENALKITKGHGAYHMTGENFLGNIFQILSHQISFAYLDNFDLITHDGRNWDQRIALYKSYGINMNNTNSKIAHMTQSILVERFAAPNSIILFDDTWIDKTTKQFDGKGAWAIRPLLQCGYKFLEDVYVGNEENGLKHGYVLLGRGDAFPNNKTNI